MQNTSLMHSHSKQKTFMFFLGIIMVLVLLYSNSSAQAACSYPSQVLDLTNWKETLPTGTSGSPTEIVQATLASYSMDPYFHPNSTCDGVVFRAPVNGVTTSGSSYPRSELREMTNDGQAKASWSTTSGTNTLFIDQAITAVPKTKKHIVAGQIHGDDDDLIVIRLEDQKLLLSRGKSTLVTLDENYTLGKRFTIKFVAKDGEIFTYYNQSPTPVHVLEKKVNLAYFKVGVYTQSNCETEESPELCSADNYGEVVIYQLEVSHE